MALEERWCGDPTSERAEKAEGSALNDIQRGCLKEEKSQGFFWVGWACTKAHQVVRLTSLLFPCALYALLPTGSRQRTGNSGLSILAVLPKYSCDIEMGNSLLILADTSDGNSGKTTEQSFKRFKCISCWIYINCISVTATEKILFPTTTNKRQQDAKRAFFCHSF